VLALGIFDISSCVELVPPGKWPSDRERSYVSEASVYRLLRAEELVPSPAFILMKAA
jgi:hypothetical protein